MIKLAIFDLDKTLAPSRQNISKTMAGLFSKLIDTKDVAVISGGKFSRIQLQVLSELPISTKFDHLTLLPQSGTACFQYKGGSWDKLYEYDFTDEEKHAINAAIEKVKSIEKPEKTYEPLVEDKGGQITYSAVGIGAPVEVKADFDPDLSKREKIASALRKLLPDFEIGIGGASSIDITKKGVDKAFGVKKLMELKNVTPEEVIYVGDALFDGGNDASVRSTGIVCKQVSGPDETEQVIASML